MKLEITIKDIEGEGWLCIKLADLSLLKRSRAFKPPTLEEVTQYCKDQKNGVDAYKWWHHYNGKGWKIGKDKMVQWRSAVATWEKDDKPGVLPGTLPASKGTNLSTGKLRKDYGEPSPDAVPMPEGMRKRMLNIGKD